MKKQFTKHESRVKNSITCFLILILFASLTTFSQTGAAIKFLSVEPLLGALDLSYWLTESIVPQLQWVIVGGESGPGARPMKEEWVTPILAECEAAGVAFLFKQWGGVDKHATGRTLNGTTYDALPTGRVARMPNDSDQATAKERL